MGLFDFFKSGPPKDLRAELFDAVERQDGHALSRLCDAHHAQILAEFPSWQKPPEDVRSDPQAMQRYANGLIGLAMYFMQERGEPALLTRLQGGDGSSDNPINAWHDALNRAERHKANLELDEGIVVLEDALARAQALTGSGVDRLLPITLGSLGVLQFQVGATEEALSSTKRALDLCRAANDVEGIQAYLSNLYEFHRYAGESTEAADCAEQLAQLPIPDGPWFRSQATIVRNGEPLNRVVVVVEGRKMEVDDAPTEGHLTFVNQRNRQNLLAATIWTQRGMDLGREGRFEEALEAFGKAAQADAHAPDPHYQSAVTHIYLRQHRAAAEAYRRTEALAPGWFHCRSEAWLAEQAAAGRLPHDTLILILEAIDGHGDPADLLRRARIALTETPDVPLLDLAAAKLLSSLGDRPGAIPHLRQGLTKSPEPDTKTRLLLDLALALDAGDESTALLREAAVLDGNLVAGATARLALRRR